MQFKRITHLLISVGLMMSALTAQADHAQAHQEKTCPSKVHYQVEVFQGASKIFSTGIDAELGSTVPVLMVNEQASEKKGVLMHVKPEYVDGHIQTLFDFHLSNMKAVSSYSNTLLSNSEQTIFVPIWHQDTDKQYLVKLTPVKL